MNDNLNKAIRLRQQGKGDEALEIFLNLLKENPNDPIINFQCAWTCDFLGKENEAVPYYEAALTNGISGKDRQGTFLGLGSTYRALGNYEKSKQIFEQALEEYPGNRAIKVFYAMCLYNLKNFTEAMKILLQEIAETTTDQETATYSKAILFYSDKLDKIWN